MTTSSLPIENVLPALREALAGHNRCLLQADPGAGKTTRVPLALLDAPWLGGRKILMLEPRRLAARNASRFMAAQLGEQPGGTVGHRTRAESRIGPQTRIEVLTEGILTRMLQEDPALESVGCVILDEFHERSLNSDLALALLLEAQSLLRDDLRLLVMSATLDAAPLLRLLGSDTPLIRSEGRSFPVETRWLGGDPLRLNCRQLAATLSDIARRESGSILCFLPGMAEIRRTQSALAELPLPEELAVCPLHGSLPPAAQQRAIEPPARGRKLVLTTSIAESSLTIEGVRVVVDSGLMRLPRFDPPSGMSRLVTLPVSRASAEQRRGRAGRLEPGVCYRLWSEERHQRLPEHRPAEIQSADLAPLRLELAAWGTPAEELGWIDPPPPAHLQQAEELLQQLGALDGDGGITALGQQMLRLGAHPRLAAMMIRAQEQGLAGLACDLAALLSEGVRSDTDDVTALLERMYSGDRRLEAVRQQSRRWRRMLSAPEASAVDTDRAGLLLSFAFPDRVARQRSSGSLHYRLANGRGAHLADGSRLVRHPWLACAELDGQKPSARIFMAAPVDPGELAACHPGLCRGETQVAWDDDAGRVVASTQRRFGTLVLEERSLTDPDPELIRRGLLEGIRRRGLIVLPWSDRCRTLQARVALLRRIEGDQGWPDLSDEALLDRLDEWLAPWLEGIHRLDQLQRLPLDDALLALLDWPQRQRLDEQAPTHIRVPSGSRIAIDYLSREEPVLAVKLQELFGCSETPAIAGGRVPLLLELLSPARRPIQTTRDLAGFWQRTYPEVKKDLKGRYPKHPWPDDPTTAEATALTKKQLARR